MNRLAADGVRSSGRQPLRAGTSISRATSGLSLVTCILVASYSMGFPVRIAKVPSRTTSVSLAE
jgi:hypothetical protein